MLRTVDVLTNKCTPLLSIGQLDVALRYGSRIATVTVFICPEITGMLISWIDCIAPDILHQQYPQPISRSQSHVSHLTLDHRAPKATPPICDFLRSVYIPHDPSEEQCASIKSAITNHFTDVFDQSEEIRFTYGGPGHDHSAEGGRHSVLC